MSAKVNAMVQAIATPIPTQVTTLNLGVMKIRLYSRRTLVLVIPTAGQTRISSEYVVCVNTNILVSDRRASIGVIYITVLTLPKMTMRPGSRGFPSPSYRVWVPRPPHCVTMQLQSGQNNSQTDDIKTNTSY